MRTRPTDDALKLALAHVTTMALRSDGWLIAAARGGADRPIGMAGIHHTESCTVLSFVNGFRVAERVVGRLLLGQRPARIATRFLRVAPIK